MADDWKPKLAAGVQVRQLPLTPTEGHLISQIDGKTTAEELALLTGLRRAEVNAILERWASNGTLAAAPGGTQSGDAATLEGQQVGATSGPSGPAAPSEADAEEETSDEELSRRGASHLQRYREQFHHLPADQRAALAATATGADLSALCLDPLPEVIRQVLVNPHAALEQARLIAAHHHTGTGLEFLLARMELVRDAQVQRLLWRNPQLNEGQLRRIAGSKRLLELWKLSTSREVTTQTRNNTMRLLRQRFQVAPAEERVELLITTEGRALQGLAGLPVDGKTTALLCARTYTSTLLINNFATWGALPPMLITHLLRQPLVQRQAHLRTRLQQHPNAPSSAR